MSNTATGIMRRIEEVGQHSGWFMALGIAFIIGGAAALLMPLVASIAVVLLVGWMFIFVGIVQLVHAWRTRDWGGTIWDALIGIVILLGGIAITIDPIVGAVTLTLLVGLVFLAKGVVQVILALNLRPRGAWGWILAAGILSIVAGVVIVFSWPISGGWVLGTLAGISFILTGWSYVMLATAARRVAAAA
jgi:uncharacterized membrane protein HdeD (DUF308 family)